MNRLEVVSSLIRSIGYDEASSILEIEFRSGKLYRYENIPLNTYREFVLAASKGRYFERHIKDAGYHYRRVD